jgi:hypothetical protein
MRRRNRRELDDFESLAPHPPAGGEVAQAARGEAELVERLDVGRVADFGIEAAGQLAPIVDLLVPEDLRAGALYFLPEDAPLLVVFGSERADRDARRAARGGHEVPRGDLAVFPEQLEEALRVGRRADRHRRSGGPAARRPAYTLAMASNYDVVPWPAAVLVAKRGRTRDPTARDARPLALARDLTKPPQ